MVDSSSTSASFVDSIPKGVTPIQGLAVCAVAAINTIAVAFDIRYSESGTITGSDNGLVTTTYT